MKKATLDPAKNLDLYFRKQRAGTKVLAFFDDLGGRRYVVDFRQRINNN
jgi:hypothetical protein